MWRSKRARPDVQPSLRPPAEAPASNAWLLGSGIVWAAATVVGMSLLWNYSLAAGAPAAAPATWPADSALSRVPGRSTLVVLAHPRCPCTQATIAELATIMRYASDRVTTHVLFSTPTGSGPDWQQTDLWQSAAAIPGVDVMSDVDGVEARRFGALTSGQVLLYDGDDRLAFAGGITAARGHRGPNVGAATVRSVLEDHPGEQRRTRVFGCALVRGDDAR
jgi:hypothetical protein